VKKELETLMNKNKFKEAEEITSNCIKDCEKFILEFKKDTKYHTKLLESIKELNSLLSIINKKITGDTSTTNELKVTKETTEKNSTAIPETTITNENGAESANYFKTKILSKEVRENATKIAEQNINFDDFPNTSYGFEKAYNSLKNKPEVFFEYIKYFNASNICKIYLNSEIPYVILAGVIQCIKLNMNKENLNIITEILNNVPKTKGFSLIKKFLKKTDKEDLKLIFSQLNSYGIDNVAEFNKLYLSN
jgi:hypothetical protein